MTNILGPILVVTILIIIFLFGLSIFGLNILVARCFLQDKKKSSPRLLVIATLLGDAVYGVFFMAIPVYFVMGYVGFEKG